MSTAFGIQQTSAGVGTTASDMRHILAAQWACTGVVDGLAVTGSTSLAYRVASGVAVCSRGASDGKTMAWYPGGATPAVAASDATKPRIDVVWVTAHDAAQGDADNLVTLGVTQGTPAATPVAPTIPTYATQLAQMLLPAGATTTANATRTAYVSHAVPYGASMGVLVDQTDTSYTTVVRGAPHVVASGTFTLPSDRVIDVSLTSSGMAANPSDSGTFGSAYIDWVLDGVVIRSFRFQTNAWSPVTAQFEDYVRAKAGTHVIQARVWGSGTAPRADFTTSYSAGNWPGQRLVVSDGGVA